jgi:hypothetical protein
VNAHRITGSTGPSYNNPGNFLYFSDQVRGNALKSLNRGRFFTVPEVLTGSLSGPGVLLDFSSSFRGL